MPSSEAAKDAADNAAGAAGAAAGKVGDALSQTGILLGQAANSQMVADISQGIKDSIPFIGKLIMELIGLAKILIPLAILCYVSYRVYLVAIKYYVQANASEYMVVLRQGKMHVSGVGLSAWTLPGDQIVKFPSTINQVSFKAEQVTQEMTGIKVSGLMIWSILRDKDGPFKCYKSFGNELLVRNSHVISEKLEYMAVSIIRDRVANLSLDDILKNRQKLKDGMKEDIQNILSGWGMWLETIEISDVTIASSTLFKNLQTAFREEQRLKAEKISAEAEDTIRNDRLVRQTAYDKKYAEANTEMQQRRIELAARQELFEMQKRVEKQSKILELANAEHQTDATKLDNSMELEDKSFQQSLKHQEQELEMKGRLYSDNVLKAMCLQATERIYQSLRISNMKVLNIGGGSGGSSQDPAGQFIKQIMDTYKHINEEK